MKTSASRSSLSLGAIPTIEEETHPLTVVVAMAANLAIAAAKFVVATIAGSAAMFAEGVHSLVDTINQGLLLFGVQRSRRAADSSHPFGYGKEIYFWTVIYSVLLAGIGGGVAILKGINGVLSPSMPEGFAYSYAVLFVAFVAEGISFWVAMRAMYRETRGQAFLTKLKETTDPTRFVIIGEDSAALLGLVTAFIGILATQITGSPIPDAIASIVVGVILCGTAIALTYKTMDLLVGQAAPTEVVRAIERIIIDYDSVLYTGPPLTMNLGRGQMLAAINVQFQRELTAERVARQVDGLETAIRARFPEFSHIYIEAQLAPADVDREQPEDSVRITPPPITATSYSASEE